MRVRKGSITQLRPWVPSTKYRVTRTFPFLLHLMYGRFIIRHVQLEIHVLE